MASADHSRLLRRRYQPATQAWIAEAPDDIRGRLETLGLVHARKQTVTHSVAGWIADYLEKRTDIKPNTARNMRQAQAFMLEFMAPEDLPLSSFTQGHAEDFRRFLLAKGQAESTVRRRCKRVKQFYASWWWTDTQHDARWLWDGSGNITIHNNRSTTDPKPSGMLNSWSQALEIEVPYDGDG